MYSAPGSRGGSFLKRNAAPLTLILILSNVVTLVLGYAAPGLFGPLLSHLTFNGIEPWREPWAFLTYPLVYNGDLWNTLFSALILWWAGSSLERAWGTRWFAAFFCGVSAAFALSLWLGGISIGFQSAPVIPGIFLPAFGVFTGWAFVNRNVLVNVWGVLPVRALYLAIVDAALLWYLVRNPVLGLFAQGGNLAAWAFVYWRPWNRFVGYRTPPPRRARRIGERESPAGWNPLAQWEERKRRQKIDALFRNSGYDDREDPPVVH